MKRAFLAFIFALASFSAPLIFPDGSTLPSDDPGISAYVIVRPNTTWKVGGEGNPPPGGDNDFQDLFIGIQFNFDGSGRADFIANNSYWKNDYFLVQGHVVNSTNFAVWSALEHDTKLHITYFTEWGGVFEIGSRNIWAGQDVPEPSTYAMICIGLFFTLLSGGKLFKSRN